MKAIPLLLVAALGVFASGCTVRGYAATPVPAASVEEQQWCERLAEALIFLHRPEVAAAAGPVSLMAAWFEQWLNGLVYELFFRAELHARHLRIFEETAKPANHAKFTPLQRNAKGAKPGPLINADSCWFTD